MVLADDDGSHEAEVEPEDIEQWVGFAAESFAEAGVDLMFDPALDLSFERSTLLNSMQGIDDDDWRAAKIAGNNLAAEHPDRLLVLLRHGPGVLPTGRGFSWYECEPVDEVVLGEQTFVLPRTNLMSYYDEQQSLTSEQIEQVGWLLGERMMRGMAMPSNVADDDLIEGETMGVEEAISCAPGWQGMSGYAVGSWSRDRQMFVGATQGASVTLGFGVSESGPQEVRLYATRAPDFGRVRVSLDGEVVHEDWNGWAPVVVPSGAIELGTHEVSAGAHTITFEVIGADERSTGFHIGVDALEFVAPGG